MKNLLPILVLFSTVCVLARAYEPTANATSVVPSSELTAIRARLDDLEKVVARTGPTGENVELRVPSLHGSIALVDGGGNKVVEVAFPEGIPMSVPSLGFYGHRPIGQEGVYGDWNLGNPDEWNQSFMFGTLIDGIGTNTGCGLVQDHRLNY